VQFQYQPPELLAEKVSLQAGLEMDGCCCCTWLANLPRQGPMQALKNGMPCCRFACCSMLSCPHAWRHSHSRQECQRQAPAQAVPSSHHHLLSHPQHRLSHSLCCPPQPCALTWRPCSCSAGRGDELHSSSSSKHRYRHRHRHKCSPQLHLSRHSAHPVRVALHPPLQLKGQLQRQAGVGPCPRTLTHGWCAPQRRCRASCLHPQSSLCHPAGALGQQLGAGPPPMQVRSSLAQQRNWMAGVQEVNSKARQHSRCSRQPLLSTPHRRTRRCSNSSSRLAPRGTAESSSSMPLHQVVSTQEEGAGARAAALRGGSAGHRRLGAACCYLDEEGW
jgi:hypothetical protein